MASRFHLQATAIATWEAHGPQVHGADWQSQFHPNLAEAKNQTFFPKTELYGFSEVIR